MNPARFSKFAPNFSYANDRFTIDASKQTTIYWVIGLVLACCICYCSMYLCMSSGFLAYESLYGQAKTTEAFVQDTSTKIKRCSRCSR